MGKFIDREQEMAFLEKEYAKKESSFVVLYGRRRIGKTSLIKEFGKNKDMIYWLVTEESEAQNRNHFKKLIAENLANPFLETAMIEEWEPLFCMLVENKIKSKKVIIIDEFQYLGKTNPAFPSIFQKIWDEFLKDKKVMVILCGSLIHMMEAQVLNYSSPLYGRRTGQIKLKQIPFRYYKEFFRRNISKRELIEKYAVTGGVPKYIESFKNEEDIYAGIQNHILNPESYLYEEPHFLLQSEVSEVGSYFSVIKSIAAGNRKLGNIASNLSVSPTSLSKYLQVLVNLDILEREVPVTEENPEKSKKGQYHIKDHFIAFWFQFVYPNRAFLEMDEKRIVLRKIKNNFVDNHVSYVYEKVCREELWDLNVKGKLGMTFDKLGRWWNAKEEIDLVGIDSMGKDIVFGECKYYKNKLMEVETFYQLKEKAKLVDWNREKRTEKYVLFSITGYTPELKKLAKKREDLILA